MMERISSGENLIGFNIFGSYAYAKAKKDKSIGYVFPKDYLVVSRLTTISKRRRIRTPRSCGSTTCCRNAADADREPGQPVRDPHDVTGETSAAGLTKELGDSLKPIQIGTGLLVYLDQSKRLAFLKQWQQAIKG